MLAKFRGVGDDIKAAVDKISFRGFVPFGFRVSVAKPRTRLVVYCKPVANRIADQVCRHSQPVESCSTSHVGSVSHVRRPASRG